MCFRIRILSPFHLVSSILHIQNHNLPKNAKNACAWAMSIQDFIYTTSAYFFQFLSKSIAHKHYYYFEAWINEFSAHFQFEKGITVPTNTDLVWVADAKSLQQRRQRFISTSYGCGEICVYARFFTFLGYLWFWMGNIKVVRWNGLEILITKHMWRSKNKLLEQI